MSPKYAKSSGLGIAVLFSPGYALACGDPGLVYILGAILFYQLALLIAIFTAHRNTLADRIKFSVLYVVSVTAIWIANEFIHGWLAEQGLFFDYVRLLGTPIVLVVILRLVLAKMA